MSEVITICDTLNPPVVDIEKAKEIYNCVRSNEFKVAYFNALLMAVVTYLDKHGVDYKDKALPWAEEMSEA